MLAQSPHSKKFLFRFQLGLFLIEFVCVGFPQVLSLDYKKLPYIAFLIVKVVIGSSKMHDRSQNKQWLREYEQTGVGLSIILYF